MMIILITIITMLLILISIIIIIIIMIRSGNLFAYQWKVDFLSLYIVFCVFFNSFISYIKNTGVICYFHVTSIHFCYRQHVHKC